MSDHFDPARRRDAALARHRVGSLILGSLLLVCALALVGKREELRKSRIEINQLQSQLEEFNIEKTKLELAKANLQVDRVAKIMDDTLAKVIETRGKECSEICAKKSEVVAPVVATPSE